MEQINDSNYERWLLLYADGALDAEACALVEAWLARHPEQAAELQLYTEAPRLEADSGVHYSGGIPGTTRRLWPALLRWTAAAAVVAAVVLPMALHKGVAPADQASPMLAQAQPSAPVPVAVPSPAEPAVPAPLSATKAVAISDAVVLAQPVPPVPVNSALPLFESEPLLAMAGDTLPADAPRLVYVDNLFVQDTLSPLEQRLVALNDEVRRSLDKGYLGRRMSRQLPSDEELVASAHHVRSRMPYSWLYIGDMVSSLAGMNE